jgi:hypothetical protein
MSFIPKKIYRSAAPAICAKCAHPVSVHWLAKDGYTVCNLCTCLHHPSEHLAEVR